MRLPDFLDGHGIRFFPVRSLQSLYLGLGVRYPWGVTAMKKLRFLVSLTTDDNDYQIEQARAAAETARRLGIDLQVIFAGNDSINQSQQLLSVIQSDSAQHPDAIIFEPVGGTALPHVGRAAAAAGIAWVVLNRQADYVAELRRASRSPVFCVSSDHLEIGRIQGRQVAILLPHGGTALFIQGPSDTSAAVQRRIGMQETTRRDVKLIAMKGQWTQESAFQVVSSWSRLSTSEKVPIDAVIAQNDAMALGARKALQQQPNAALREKLLSVPFLGCDGLPGTGKKQVSDGALAATVVIPPNTALAIEMTLKALQDGVRPAEIVLTQPLSFPALDELAKRAENKGAVTTR
ncbi:MAG: substrate-binding domain-containing protein [Candidatus Acidiferrales bacterium]